MNHRVPQNTAAGLSLLAGFFLLLLVSSAEAQQLALSPADVDAAAAVLGVVDTIILQFEIPLETIYHTVRFARAHKIRCIVNPAPALPADLASLAAELLILIEGFDDTFSQVVHSMYSYRHDEIVWGAQFIPAFKIDSKGDLVVEVDRIDEMKMVS